MGLFDILGGIMNKLEEHSPEIMAAMENAMERAQKNMDKKQEDMDKKEAFEAEYSGLSNQELQNILDQGATGPKRAALASIAQKRKAAREEYQKVYSSMSTIDLRIEYQKVRAQKREGMLEEPIADLRLSIISKVLRERGWHQNSDLGWDKEGEV